jgi:Zn-dependent protease with chaperone function
VLAGPPAQAEDEGKMMERVFGVFGRTSPEGSGLNDRLDRVLRRLSDASGYTVKSAKILGGKHEAERLKRQRERDEQGLPPKPARATRPDNENTDQLLNAFALPDGRVYVTLGLMRAIEGGTDPDAMLAFVLGHEITHVTEHHARTMIRKARTSGILAGVAAAILGAGADTAFRVADLSAGLTGTHHSRIDEYKADRGGLLAMRKAGYATTAGVDALELIRSRYGDGDPATTGWFGSHPLTRNRILRLKQLSREIEAGRVPGDSTEKELQREESRGGTPEPGSH